MVPTFNQDSTEFPSLPHKSTIHSDIKKKITYFFFNLNRLNSDQDIDTLSLQLDFLISFSKKMYQDTSNVYEKKAFLYYLLILYKLIAHTRDISHGKGERKLTYMMIYSWYKFLPIPALFALKNIIYNSDSTPMGSWKDIKYFCHYVKDHSYIGCEDPLIISVLEIMNKQLYQDFIKMNDPNYKISTVAKWVPRENTKFGWVFYKLVLHWFTSYEPLFLSTPKNEEQYIRALCKCCRQYRIMISKMNRLLGTVEIKQCANDWSNIETTHVNTYSLLGKQNVFFSKNELPSAINPEIREKKVKCIRKFKQYFQDIIDSSGNAQSRSFDLVRCAAADLSGIRNLVFGLSPIVPAWPFAKHARRHSSAQPDLPARRALGSRAARCACPDASQCTDVTLSVADFANGGNTGDAAMAAYLDIDDFLCAIRYELCLVICKDCAFSRTTLDDFW